MKILIVNDDGIHSHGIHALWKELSTFAEVTVVAPVTEQSAVGHAITIWDTLRVTEVQRDGAFFGYGVNGTPADCVKIALDALMPQKPDLVVSGINQGANLATNVIYSGTVSAATEGAMLGVPSMAVSLASSEYRDFSVAARFAGFYAKKMLSTQLPPRALFNINVPPVPEEQIKGWKYAVQGMTRYLDFFEKRVDPRGRTYYWLTGEISEVSYDAESDDIILKEGYITVTPLQFDMTDRGIYSALKGTESGDWK